MSETQAPERVYRREKDADWGDGPWMDEPDKMQWRDEATGYACIAVRNHMGCWCGYVGVTEGHPAYGVDYDDVEEVDVHGGLTFADFCQEGDETHAICHVPEPGEPDRVWWVGFDCGHAFDYIPRIEAGNRKRYEETGDPLWAPRVDWPPEMTPTYRDLDYVRGECAHLAAQLKEAEHGRD